ncbi:hypothetical protein CSV63_11015 [Sporosarcina sp. P34]|uniref:hypothetical protein n=1 Tax=Sporosarcina sp. P34 TaxID=2048247 RepID=UPI000C1726B5|nr:hypothetical protein [Sporosarcina sp. P34]PID14620.1 hypothetical protein CSV63_11015 [Sporosarcina sp. P34]
MLQGLVCLDQLPRSDVMLTKEAWRIHMSFQTKNDVQINISPSAHNPGILIAFKKLLKTTTNPIFPTQGIIGFMFIG